MWDGRLPCACEMTVGPWRDSNHLPNRLGSARLFSARLVSLRSARDARRYRPCSPAPSGHVAVSLPLSIRCKCGLFASCRCCSRPSAILVQESRFTSLRCCPRPSAILVQESRFVSLLNVEGCLVAAPKRAMGLCSACATFIGSHSTAREARGVAPKLTT